MLRNKEAKEGQGKEEAVGGKWGGLKYRKRGQEGEDREGKQ